jgi:hypothetical protein
VRPLSDRPSQQLGGNSETRVQTGRLAPRLGARFLYAVAHGAQTHQRSAAFASMCVERLIREVLRLLHQLHHVN